MHLRFKKERPLGSSFARGTIKLECKDSGEKRQKVGAALAHITSVEESNNPQKATEKIERLRNTIDSLLTSFAHGNLSVAIQTRKDSGEK